MEVVSTLNLGSSQTKKTTACNFQTMNSCVMSYDFMRGQIGSHANNKVFKTTNKPGEEDEGDTWRCLLIDTMAHRLKISKENNIVLHFFFSSMFKAGFFYP